MDIERSYCDYTEEHVKKAEESQYPHIQKLDKDPDGKYLVMQRVLGREVSFRTNKVDSYVLRKVRVDSLGAWVEMPNKVEVRFLKLNDDPDVSDLGIISYSVVMPVSVNSASIEGDAEHYKSFINGLDNPRVMPEHRVEELDDPENIALAGYSEVDIETPLGLREYRYRTSREPNTVFGIECRTL